MASIFEHRKPNASQSPREMLLKLRSTLEQLEAKPEEERQIADLKRILSVRIRELESKTA